MPVLGGNAIDHGFAYAGMVVDNQVENSISKLNKSDTTSIAPGLGVITDGDDGAKLAGAVFTAAEFVGVVKRELNRAVLDGASESDNRQRDMTIVTEGVVYVTASAAITKDQPAFVDQDGTWYPTDNGGTAIQITTAKFVSTAGIGELVKLSLGLGG